MCDAHEDSAGAAWSAPRAAEGPAVDPVTLPAVDEVTVTTMVDNTFDALLAPADGVTRAPMGAGRVAAWQFAGGETVAGLRAEHGFSALVTVRSGETSSSLLFDTGASPDALAVNAERLGIDVGGLQGVVLSHGHFDHAGGLDGLARLRRGSGLPLTVHPAVWTRRRLELPGGRRLEMPVLSRGALEREGFQVIERRQPSLLAGGRSRALEGVAPAARGADPAAGRSARSSRSSPQVRAVSARPVRSSSSPAVSLPAWKCSPRSATTASRSASDALIAAGE
jgi:7,8-dihydropterin-6-yl-methyl-4-(beta-D-ribofuranosyl)aminobenzene 5'-phosphate synthase